MTNNMNTFIFSFADIITGNPNYNQIIKNNLAFGISVTAICETVFVLNTIC